LSIKDLNIEPKEKEVTLYNPKRNPFYKLGFNENHIPNQSGYEKARKKRLDLWENPTHSWPPYLPRPTMHSGKTLISEVEREYKE
jgi:ribosomal protein L19